MKKRWLPILFNLSEIARWPRLVVKYYCDWKRYQKLKGEERLLFVNSYPCLYERSGKTAVDPHYFYQGAWAMSRILQARPARHVDIGSEHRWAGLLSVNVPVLFVDVRPVDVRLPHFESRSGDLLHLPFADNSVMSLSSLHVVEHVGLGRYGDKLDPAGTYKALNELVRVLAPGGRLYLALPVGRPRVCFNAHRIVTPELVLEACAGLDLVEFSCVDDGGQMIENCEPGICENARYACGLFLFGKA